MGLPWPACLHYHPFWPAEYELVEPLQVYLGGTRDHPGGHHPLPCLTCEPRQPDARPVELWAIQLAAFRTLENFYRHLLCRLPQREPRYPCRGEYSPATPTTA